MHRKTEYSSLALEPVGFNMFRSLELTGLVTNIDKLSLFDLEKFAAKKLNPTNSRAQSTTNRI